MPVPTSVVASGEAANRPTYDPSIVRQRRRRVTAGWVVGALAAGLAVGLGAQKIFSDDESPEVETGAVVDPPQQVAPPPSDPEPPPQDPVIVLDEEPEPPKAESRPKPRRKPRKQKPKPAKVDPAPSPSGKKEYLPPSRRGD